MAKKSFNNPTEIRDRKGLDLLISDNVKQEQEPVREQDYSVPTYIHSNVRVRRDLREKIYAMKGKTGMQITDIYTMIFEEYFKNNPL